MGATPTLCCAAVKVLFRGLRLLRRARHNSRRVLVAEARGPSMAIIDGAVEQVALPVLERTSGVILAEMQRVVEAYTLLLKALIRAGRTADDRFLHHCGADWPRK